jgi:AraC-like DNA-binding protein
MLLKRINNWFQHAKKYFFTYNDGFFELSYLDNSPKAMVESLIKMPFVTHDTRGQILRTNNAFVEGVLHYQELEEGLWVMYSEMKYKANVRYKGIYDEYIPCDYYLLNFNINTNDVLQNSTKASGVALPARSWAFFKRKPHKNNSVVFNFKNSYAIDITIHFNEAWIEKNLKNNQKFIDSKLNNFLNLDLNHILWPENSIVYDNLIEDIQATIHAKGSKGVANLLRLKMDAIGLLSTFIEKYKNENIHENHYEIPNSDRLRMHRIERYLYVNLEKKFDGIDALSDMFNVSPTKLKNDFKLMYGKSIFQYFQEKQMLLAKEIMENEDVRIKELAYKFGYENAGKFSLAYKKHFNILPSEQLKTV